MKLNQLSLCHCHPKNKFFSPDIAALPSLWIQKMPISSGIDVVLLFSRLRKHLRSLRNIIAGFIFRSLITIFAETNYTVLIL